jgi:hypothetical protein
MALILAARQSASGNAMVVLIEWATDLAFTPPPSLAANAPRQQHGKLRPSIEGSPQIFQDIQTPRRKYILAFRFVGT